MNPANVVVLYHSNCCDGFGAAWAAHKLYGDDARYVPVRHHESPPEGLDNRDVLIVDFSYPRQVLLDIEKRAASIRVLDHHTSAEAELGDLDFAIFDMHRSGAGITWDVLHPYKSRPKIIDFVEDRDIWKWELPEAAEVLIILECVPFEFDKWDSFAERLDTVTGFKDITNQGRAVLRHKKSNIDRILQKAHRTELTLIVQEDKCDQKITYNIPCVNSPVFQSELGNKLCQDEPFAMVWQRVEDGRYICSLRSDKNGEDVSEIASYFGGGGHEKAAAFPRTSPPVMAKNEN